MGECSALAVPTPAAYLGSVPVVMSLAHPLKFAQYSASDH